MDWGLAGAVAAPVAAVGLCAWLHARPRLTRIVDLCVYVAVPLLVAWMVLPDAWRQQSVLPLLAVAAGAAVVIAAERLFRARAAQADDVAIVFGFFGLAVHAFLEGAALSPGVNVEGGAAFAMAVTLHRLVEGSMVWWLLWPRHGWIAVVLALSVFCGATMAGYAVGSEAIWTVHGRIDWQLGKAFVAGTLLHVVFHQGRRDHAHDDLGGADD